MMNPHIDAQWRSNHDVENKKDRVLRGRLVCFEEYAGL
jgi:hypothetical protein